jgi:hypothetical protein
MFEPPVLGLLEGYKQGPCHDLPARTLRCNRLILRAHSRSCPRNAARILVRRIGHFSCTCAEGDQRGGHATTPDTGSRRLLWTAKVVMEVTAKTDKGTVVPVGKKED